MARVKGVRIRNIMGIEELEFEPGKVTRIQGENASGKSSVLEALKALVAGGHDATLLRAGEEEGEVVILIDPEDGTGAEVEARKRVTAEKSDLSVRHSKLGTLGAPKRYIDGLLDATAFNPVAFLTASDRVERLLEAADSRVEEADLAAAIEGVPEDEVELPELAPLAELPALQAIEALASRIYSARTGVNRIVREKSTTAEELRSSLPADGAAPEQVSGQLRSAEAQLEKEREEEREKIEEARELTRQKIKEAQENSASVVAELQTLIEEEEARARDAVQKLKDEREAAVEQIRSGYSEEIDRWVSEVGTLRERLRAVEDAERSRALIEKAEEEAERRAAESEALTAALERLEALKLEALDSLPIEGATIEGGELFVDGVAFDRLNSARKVEEVMKIAEARAGELGLMIVDDLELLDAEHFEAMVEAIEASPLQAIVTRVTDGTPLTISTGADS